METFWWEKPDGAEHAQLIDSLGLFDTRLGQCYTNAFVGYALSEFKLIPSGRVWQEMEHSPPTSLVKVIKRMMIQARDAEGDWMPTPELYHEEEGAEWVGSVGIDYGDWRAWHYLEANSRPIRERHSQR